MYQLYPVIREGFDPVTAAALHLAIDGALRANGVELNHDPKLFIQGGAPPVISWFINPMKTIVISTINHSYWSYKPT